MRATETVMGAVSMVEQTESCIATPTLIIMGVLVVVGMVGIVLVAHRFLHCKNPKAEQSA